MRVLNMYVLLKIGTYIVIITIYMCLDFPNILGKKSQLSFKNDKTRNLCLSPLLCLNKRNADKDGFIEKTVESKLTEYTADSSNQDLSKSNIQKTVLGLRRVIRTLEKMLNSADEKGDPDGGEMVKEEISVMKDEKETIRNNSNGGTKKSLVISIDFEKNNSFGDLKGNKENTNGEPSTNSDNDEEEAFEEKNGVPGSGGNWNIIKNVIKRAGPLFDKTISFTKNSKKMRKDLIQEMRQIREILKQLQPQNYNFNGLNPFKKKCTNKQCQSPQKSHLVSSFQIQDLSNPFVKTVKKSVNKKDKDIENKIIAKLHRKRSNKHEAINDFNLKRNRNSNYRKRSRIVRKALPLLEDLNSGKTKYNSNVHYRETQNKNDIQNKVVPNLEKPTYDNLYKRFLPNFAADEKNPEPISGEIPERAKEYTAAKNLKQELQRFLKSDQKSNKLTKMNDKDGTHFKNLNIIRRYPEDELIVNEIAPGITVRPSESILEIKQETLIETNPIDGKTTKVESIIENNETNDIPKINNVMSNCNLNNINKAGEIEEVLEGNTNNGYKMDRIEINNMNETNKILKNGAMSISKTCKMNETRKVDVGNNPEQNNVLVTYSALEIDNERIDINETNKISEISDTTISEITEPNNINEINGINPLLELNVEHGANNIPEINNAKITQMNEINKTPKLNITCKISNANNVGETDTSKVYETNAVRVENNVIKIDYPAGNRMNEPKISGTANNKIREANDVIEINEAMNKKMSEDDSSYTMNNINEVHKLNHSNKKERFPEHDLIYSLKNERLPMAIKQIVKNDKKPPVDFLRTFREKVNNNGNLNNIRTKRLKGASNNFKDLIFNKEIKSSIKIKKRKSVSNENTLSPEEVKIAFHYSKFHGNKQPHLINLK